MPVSGSASQTRICLAYREFRTHLLVLVYIINSPNRDPAQTPFWNNFTGFQSRLKYTSKLPSWLSSHSIAIAPSYLSSLVCPYIPSCALRSSSAHQLCVPHVSTVRIRLARVQIGRPNYLEFLAALSCVVLHYRYLQSRNNLRHTPVRFSLPF